MRSLQLTNPPQRVILVDHQADIKANVASSDDYWRAVDRRLVKIAGLGQGQSDAAKEQIRMG